MSVVDIVMFFTISMPVALYMIRYPSMRPRGVAGYPHVRLMDVELTDVTLKAVGGDEMSGYVLTVIEEKFPGPTSVDACTHSV